MKKVILAVAIASVCGAASAATVTKNEDGDFLKVYGGMEVGGSFVADKDNSPFKSTDGYIDDSFLTLGAKGQTGDFFAKFELDAERQNWTKDNHFRLVIDKAFVGYKLPNKMGSIEVGRTDTAYDHYDAFGDFTNELAFSVSEAGDQDNTVKYRGQFGSFKVGISHSLEGFDGVMKEDGTPDKYSYITDSRHGAVTNGYLGYFGDSFTVIGGAESVADYGRILSVHGEYKINALAFGGFVSQSTPEAKGNDSTTVVASVSYKLTKKLKAYAVASKLTHDKASKEDQNIVFGAEYKPAKNIKLVAEASFGHEEDSSLGYAKAYYWF